MTSPARSHGPNNPSAARVATARAASIIGHPIVTVLAAAMFTASSQGASRDQLRFIGGSIALLSVIALGYSWAQVRAGRWDHVDASARKERASLNVFLASLLLLGALATWATGRPVQMSIALALSALIVIVGMATARWVKASLHASFAAFSTALVWPSRSAVLVGIALTAIVVWSRLVLRRHVLADVIAGVLLGAAAGIAYQGVVP